VIICYWHAPDTPLDRARPATELRATSISWRDELFRCDRSVAKATNNKTPVPRRLIMNRRPTRSRVSFALESLEIRNAPSHFGVVAHVAAVHHVVHAAAQVRHVTDSEVNRQKEVKEASSSVDSSQDGVNDPSNGSSTSTDLSSTDPKSDR
jgi:hypothetical protein